jgi:hypothetical protein
MVYYLVLDIFFENINICYNYKEFSGYQGLLISGASAVPAFSRGIFKKRKYRLSAGPFISLMEG